MATAKATPKSAPDQPTVIDEEGNDVTPAVAEVEDKPLEIDYGGNTYTIERSAFTTNRFLKALEQDKSYTMVEALLGERQYGLFESRHPQYTEFGEFIEAFSAVAGSGKLLALASIVREHHSALEFDLAGHGPGYSLLDFWRGQITPRWLWMFITNLPPTSALHRKLGQGWTVTDYLLANLIDLGTGAGGDNDVPRFPRPGDEDRQRAREQALTAGKARFLERQRAREEAERHG